MKTLGATYIETLVEVPTKLLNGKQYYKTMKIWAPVPHEMIDERHLRVLRGMVETSLEGFIEIMIENKKDAYTPRYYKLRGVIQTYVQIESAK